MPDWGKGGEDIQEPEAEHAHQHVLLPARQLQRADDGHGEREDQKVGDEVDACHYVPNRRDVDALAGNGRVPEGCHGLADERQQEGEGHGPGGEEAQRRQRDALDDGVGEQALVLEQDGYLGQAHGHVVDDDRRIESLHVGDQIALGDDPGVSAEAVCGFYADGNGRGDGEDLGGDHDGVVEAEASEEKEASMATQDNGEGGDDSEDGEDGDDFGLSSLGVEGRVAEKRFGHGEVGAW